MTIDEKKKIIADELFEVYMHGASDSYHSRIIDDTYQPYLMEKADGIARLDGTLSTAETAWSSMDGKAKIIVFAIVFGYIATCLILFSMVF